MKISSPLRVLAAVVGLLAVLTVLRFRPWQRAGAGVAALERLTIGFLPVT